MACKMDLRKRGDIHEAHGSLISTPSSRLTLTSSSSTTTRYGHEAGSAFATSNTSIDESEPPSPTSGPATNFGEVASGIYRSAFPRENNFDHMSSLGLKTILTLVDGEYPAENLDYIASRGIYHVQIAIPPNKDTFASIPMESMAQALEVLHDERNHPVLVHCNKGKHRTGCVIGCYRKMNDWTMGSILEEYRRYAGSKARLLDEKYMELFDEHAMTTRLEGSFRVATKERVLVTPPASEEN